MLMIKGKSLKEVAIVCKNTDLSQAFIVLRKEFLEHSNILDVILLVR